MAEGEPFAPIEGREHRPPEIQRALRWRLAARRLEAHAQGDAVVERERGHVADLHAARQSAAARRVLAGHAPERRHAREQQEQREHDRRAQQRHAPRQPQRHGQRRPAHGHVGVDQGGQQAQQCDQHRGGRRERLREEEVAEHREEAQEEQHHGVAPRVHFHGLEREQHHDERDARVAADDGAVRHHRERDRCGQQHAQLPAPRLRTAAQREHAPPDQHGGGERRGPRGQVGRQRQHHPAHRGEQEQRVARLARQVRERPTQRGHAERPSGGGPGRGGWIVVSTAPVPPGSAARGPAHCPGRSRPTAAAGRSPGPAARPAAPRRRGGRCGPRGR